MLMWVPALGTTGGCGPRGRLAEAVLAGAAGCGPHPWSVALSFLWAPDHEAYLWATAALLTLGLYAERRLCSARYGTALVFSHVMSSRGNFTVAWAAGFLFPDWGQQLIDARFGGPGLGVAGAATAATASMETRWRRGTASDGAEPPLPGTRLQRGFRP